MNTIKKQLKDLSLRPATSATETTYLLAQESSGGGAAQKIQLESLYGVVDGKISSYSSFVAMSYAPKTNIGGGANNYAPINNPTFTGTVSGITKSMVGLSEVTNESKLTMFNNPAFTGTIQVPAAVVDYSPVRLAQMNDALDEKASIQLVNDRVPSTYGVSGRILIGSYDNSNSWAPATPSLVGLGNVTNESKSTMFNNPRFTGPIRFVSNETGGIIGSDDNLIFGFDSDQNMTISPTTTFINGVYGINKSMVGLGNVANESKATMFTNPTFTGNVVVPNGTLPSHAVNRGQLDEYAEYIPTVRTSGSDRGCNIISKVTNGGDGMELIYIDYDGGLFNPVLSGQETLGFRLTIKNYSVYNTEVKYDQSEIYWIDNSFETAELYPSSCATFMCVGPQQWVLISTYGTVSIY
jgi:hypothetical protein